MCKEIDFIETYRHITFENKEGTKEEKTKNFLASFKNMNVNNFVELIIEKGLNAFECFTDASDNFKSMVIKGHIFIDTTKFKVEVKGSNTIVKIKK